MTLKDLLGNTLVSAYNSTVNTASIGSILGTYALTSNNTSTFTNGICTLYATAIPIFTHALIKSIKKSRSVYLTPTDKLKVLETIDLPEDRENKPFDIIEIIEDDNNPLSFEVIDLPR
tara:strand:+ start:2173 stop:2526 length:354 start_codon:yes stop_codon:yes gene_type:complete